MAENTNSPKIAALKKEVERKFGHKIDSRTDFTYLNIAIKDATHAHIAENTLRRLWGKLKGYNTVYVRTLDILSRYTGFEHWDDFCQNLGKQKATESYIVSGQVSIRAEDLVPGDRIRIGWFPDRLCVVEYQGGRLFKALDCKNSTLQNGDSFECTIMIKNYPLFVDNLVHGGEICLRYSMGLTNGLTTLEKIQPQKR